MSVELHHWPGTFHDSQVIASLEVLQRQIAGLAAACAEPWPTDAIAADQAGYSHATTDQMKDHHKKDVSA